MLLQKCFQINTIILLYYYPKILCAVSNDRNFLDDDIPDNWRDYVPKDLLDDANAFSPSSPLFQGDISGIEPEAIGHSQATLHNAINDANALWPHKLIPYEFSLQISEGQEKFMRSAMKDMESKTCVRFIPRKYEPDYIKIVGGFDCSSYVGRQREMQLLTMNAGCMDGLGAVQHELMHALGFFHEQTRPDRDKYIWINKKNLPTDETTQAQFAIKLEAEVTQLGTGYDYDSVMHYGWNAFARNTKYPTFLPKQKGRRTGNRQQLSETDIKRINLLYECNVTTPEVPETTKDYSKTWTNWFVLCDGKADTPEGRDENSDVCLSMCDKLDQKLFGGKSLFNLPTTKRCMHKTYLCDGIQDSPNDTSEDPDICKQFCHDGGYINILPTLQCIHFMKLCDGKVDVLADGSDEVKENCIKYCNSPALESFKGKLFNLEPTGRCMMKKWLCDGIKDSDADTSEDPKVCHQYCRGDGFIQTSDMGQCIHYSKLCDLTVDTQTGWDEVRSNCEKVCPNVTDFIGDLFNLPSTSQCLSKRALCNGVMESKDGSNNDQNVCIEKCVGNYYFPVDEMNQCIKVTDLCDGKKDTRTGWDENVKNCSKYCRLMNTNRDLIINPKTKRCSLLPKM